MKRIVILMIILSIILVGCSSEETPETSQEGSRDAMERREVTQEERDEMERKTKEQEELLKDKEESKEESDDEDAKKEGEISDKLDFQIEAEENAKMYPADSVATFEGAKFKGMDYYYKGTIVGITEIDNIVGEPSSWLVENDRGYIMPIQHEYFEADVGDVVEVWGTLSGNMYDLSSIGYEGIIDKVGSMHAMMVTVNGEMQY